MKMMRMGIGTALVAFAALMAEGRGVFSVGCVNHGQRRYSDGVTSRETYDAHWRRLYEENPADIWFGEDVTGSPDPHRCLEAKVSRRPIADDLVELAGSCPEGQTRRRFARRLVYDMDGRRVAVYGVHLVAESHVSPRKGPDGRSPSQRLRQRQFADLLKDAAAFDDAVFAGDFNAQEAWEYDVFNLAGYACANCSDRFGRTATLRDIPADNIVVSSGLRIESFEVVHDLTLDTDHLPLLARISLRPIARASDFPSVSAASARGAGVGGGH